MKASEQSPTAANLIAELIAKLNVQDDSPLCTLLACHMAKLIGDAQTRDCQDAEPRDGGVTGARREPLRRPMSAMALLATTVQTAREVR